MNRDEFINWLTYKSGFTKKSENYDNEWRELMNYAEYIWDELTVESDKVIFNWEEWIWGGVNYKSRECTFEEFITLYDSYNLK